MTRLGAVLRLVVGRMRHDRAVLAGAALIVLLATSLVAAGLIYADAVSTAGLQRRLASAAPPSSSVEIGGPLRADRLPAVDEAVRGVAGETFGAADVAVWSRLSSASFALPEQPGPVVSELALVRSFEALERHATLEAGSWPAETSAGPIDAALSVAAADDLGLAVGDELRLTSRLDPEAVVELRITGLWRPNEPTERYWWADELDLSGVDQGATYTTHGPFVVASAAFLEHAQLTDGAAADWRLVPDIDAIGVTAVGGLVERLDGMAGRLPGGGQLAVRGELADVLRAADRALTVTRASVTVVTLQLAILAGYALVLTGGLIVERRRAETALAGARGATRAQLVGAAAIEAAVIALPCAVAAPWLAALVLRAFNVAGPLAETGLGIEPSVGLLAITAAALAGLGCVVGLALPALSRRSVVVERTTRGRAARRAQLQRAGVDIALVVLAGVALWQLQRIGSPLSSSVRERVGIDPLLVAAPAIGLIAGAIIALRILPLTARVADLAAGAGQGVVAPLGAWQLARRPLRYAPVTLLLIVTVALGVFALGYGQSWARSQADQVDFAIGADVRVEPQRSGSRAGLGSEYQVLPGVEATMAVTRSRIDLAGVTTSDLLLLDARAAGSTMRLRGDLGSAGALLGDLAARRPDAVGVALPGASRRLAVDLRLTVAGEAAPGSADPFVVPEMRLAAVVSDANGVLHRLTSEALTADGDPQRAVIPLGAGRGRLAAPATIVGFELVTRVANNGAMEGTLSLERLMTSDEPGGQAWTLVGLGDAWVAAARSAGRPSGSAALEPPLGVSFTSAGPRARSTPPLTVSLVPAALADLQLVPAIVASDVFAARATRGTGSEIPLDFGFGSVAAPILGQLRAIPTTDPERPAAIADLGTVSLLRYVDDGTVLEPNEWWLAVGGDPQPVVAALRGAAFQSRSVLARGEVTAERQTDPVALGVLGALIMGVLAAGAFAVVGFVASTAMAARERLSEFAVLRALGLSTRQLAGWLAIENVTVVALSLLIGTALGLVITRVVVPFVALTPDATAPFPALRISVPWGQVILFELATVAALAVALAVIVVLLRRIGLGAALRIGED